MSNTPEIPYASVANLLTKSGTANGTRSKSICAAIKAGKKSSIESVFKHFTPEVKDLFHPFLNENVTLVPIPRSSRLVEGGVWASKVIADLLVDNGYGCEVVDCLERAIAVPKSSQYTSAKDRVTVQRHIESIQFSPAITGSSDLTLIDDVITLGRTSYSCASILQDAFPSKTIRIFTIFCTKGLAIHKGLDQIIDPHVGSVKYNEQSGKTLRTD